MAAAAVVTYVKEIAKARDVSVASVLRDAGLTHNYLSRLDQWEDPSAPKVIALVKQVGGRLEHLPLLLAENVTDEEVNRLVNEAVQLKEAELNQAVELFDDLLSSPTRLLRWLEYGRGLRDATE